MQIDMAHSTRHLFNFVRLHFDARGLSLAPMSNKTTPPFASRFP